MCGIIGLYGDYDSNKFISALDKLKHRGVDDIGHYFNAENNIALGHTRLSILDTSSLGHQPMLSSDEKVILIFNGEVFNFKELRNDLESQGYEFIGNSDTEVLLNLYLSEGIKMLTKINGIFAFALVDLRSKELFLARDAFGVKPLYFSSLAGIVITSISFVLAIVLIVSKITNPAFSIQGWTSMTVIILFFGGIQLLSIGILGIYISKIYREVKGRPLYIVESTENIEHSNNER